MKSRTGNSPAHFASMIKTQSWRVSEVSDTLGFVNPFHFTRVFRRFHGLPPTTAGCSPPQSRRLMARFVGTAISG
jgi:AraC-like DNA-binding protein